MAVINVESLNKVFFTTVKKEGFGGTLRNLVRPEKKEFQAVKNLSFSIAEGEFVGFLGPNGAGKTTTIKMLTGILFPTSGSIDVLGHDPFRRNPELLRQIALVMGNRQQLWWDLPARESFNVLREIYGIELATYKQRLDSLIEPLALTDKLDVQVRKLSLGERMKCELVAALLHSPRVVFLDEPTIGLDLTSQRAMREFLKDYNRRENATILLTSHYMQDVEELCERVMVINHGTLVFDGALTELSAKFGHAKRIKVRLADPVEESVLAAIGPIQSNEGLEVSYSSTPQQAAALTADILAKLPVADLVIEDPDIESVVERAFQAPAT